MNVVSNEFEQHIINEVMRRVDCAVKEIERRYAVRTRYMNLENACIYADVSRPTLNDWLAKGLPVSQIGGAKRIDAYEIDKFIAMHRIGEVRKCR